MVVQDIKDKEKSLTLHCSPQAYAQKQLPRRSSRIACPCTHSNRSQAKKQLITQNIASEPAEVAHLQLLGELSNGLLAVLAEHGDGLSNEVRVALVLEQKQLLELLVEQTLTQENKRKAKNIAFPNTIKLVIHQRRN
jgi:hypothetical protein